MKHLCIFGQRVGSVYLILLHHFFIKRDSFREILSASVIKNSAMKSIQNSMYLIFNLPFIYLLLANLILFQCIYAVSKEIEG